MASATTSTSDLLAFFKQDAQIAPDCTMQVSYQFKPGVSRRKVKVEKKWYREKEIGRGTFGTVWLEVDEKEGGVTTQRAVKEVSKALMRNLGIDIRREILALSTLSKYPREFVDFYGWFENTDHVYFCMEYFPHGDLENYVAAGFTEEEAKSITLQLLEGLAFMHKNHFTHRDLKPQVSALLDGCTDCIETKHTLTRATKNIFVVAKSPQWWVKIGDFGITKRVASDLTALNTQTGTPLYRAPEVSGFVDEDSDAYTNAVDMWSLGCVAYKLLAQRVPFANGGVIMRFCSGKASFPVEALSAKDVSEEGVRFLESLLVPEPSERLSVEAALQAAWLEEPEEPPSPIHADVEGAEAAFSMLSTKVDSEDRSNESTAHTGGASTAVNEAHAPNHRPEASYQQHLKALQLDDILIYRHIDVFEMRSKDLCRHVQQWTLRFSKFSDTSQCRLVSDIRDEKTMDRFDNAVLDGSDVEVYLADRVKRRDVFMSVMMTMIWEFVFTRYLFGMDRELRQKLKQLEKNLGEVGPDRAVCHWRAVTLSLLAKREGRRVQCAHDCEAVVQEIYRTLAQLLPPPHHIESELQDSLRRVVRFAVDISIEMRTQEEEYIMLPPLVPEYDSNGDLARQVLFNASLMNERSVESVDLGLSNEELEAERAVVRMVLFPLVVKKEFNGDEVVVFPAQVLVANAARWNKQAEGVPF